MRIGLVSPYSLTVPGGVQAQVLGLARELRRRGHEARVLGPCDGPPPESFVTPLGNSLPTAANGSMAPLAPDASAALRTIRALQRRGVRRDPPARADGARHHDDGAAGPSGADGRDVPRRRHLRRLSDAAAGAAPGVNRLDHRVVVSKDALELVREHIGGDYDVLFNGVDIDAIRADADRSSVTRHGERGTSRRSSSAAATSIARACRCCSTRSSRCRRPGHGVGGERRPGDGGADGPTSAEPDRSSGSAGSPRPRSSAACARATCSAPRRSAVSRSASCSSRRWRPAPPWSPARSTATATSPPTGVDVAARPPGDVDALAAALDRGARRPGARRPSPRRREPRVPRTSPCPGWPIATSRSTSGLIRSAAAPATAVG